MSFSRTFSTRSSRKCPAVCGAVLLCLSAPVTTVGQTSPTSDVGAPRLTIDRLYSLPNLIGTAPGGFAWSADGRYVAFLWNDEGGNFRDVWMLDVENPEGTPERVTRMPRAEVPATDPDDPVSAAEADSRFESDRGVQKKKRRPVRSRPHRASR